MLTPQGNTTDVYSVIDKQVKRRMDEMIKKEFGHELFSPFLFLAHKNMATEKRPLNRRSFSVL